ncbi:glycoside hydrolase family protein [Aquimarina algicola]|uniref:Iota-carrageenase n=1 Tax=Aquimarina algicola TaxID=2589995 RepID=A0A504JF28_9FLAO|nr:hypothetical protein [Aquimarina algicola]TPN86233.1 hypothetical protein FHK87_13270 [Aquimarina algicola]
MIKRNLLCFFLLCYVFSSAQFPVARFDGSTPSTVVSLPDANVKSTSQLQKLINNAGPKGIKISIPAGNYTLGQINLASNVHIDIDKDAYITVAPGNNVLFNLRTRKIKDPKLENIKIYCSNCDTSKPAYDDDRYYTIDYTSYGPKVRIRAFSIERVENFHISDFKVLDNYTTHSAVNIVPLITGPFSKKDPGNTDPNVNNRRAVAVAKKGDIINGCITGAAYGYGLIQVQCAVDVSFKDLYGVGGVTLRFESGAGATYIGTLIDTDIAVIKGIQAQNINCTDGKVALMLSPHGRIHGDVEVRDVTATGCGFAVKAEGGFIDREIRDPNNFSANSNPSKYKKGIFQSVKVTNVTAIYKSNTAQIKAKDWKFYPESIRLKDFNEFKKSPNGGIKSPTKPVIRYKTPSIAPISYTSIDHENDIIPKMKGLTDKRYAGNNEGDGKFNVEFTGTISAKGFLDCFDSINNTIYDEDANSNYCQ